MPGSWPVVVLAEVSRNPNQQRQAFAAAILEGAQEQIALNTMIEIRATELEQQGIKAVDALHWASAEYAQVDYFCTCDDRFYRKIKSLAIDTLKIVTPLELAQEVLP